jgi:HSP20 family molecular chaperone IbpA
MNSIIKIFTRNILLPENADVEFIAAEYREGILKIYIPKDGESSTISINHVVVY